MGRKLRGEELETAVLLAKNGCKQSLDMVIESSMGLVGSLAIQHVKKYMAAGRSDGVFDDAVQEGVLGLIEAVKHFDPSRGSFITCAWQWIRAYVNRYLKRVYDGASSEYSLNEEVDSDDGQSEYMDLVRYEAPSPAEIAERSELLVILREEAAVLKSKMRENHRLVLQMRIEAESPATLEDTGRAAGFTRERARQIEESIKSKLTKRVSKRIAG